MKDGHPFKIDFTENLDMHAFDVRLQIGEFKDKEEARLFADTLTNWLVGKSGWKMKAN